MNDDFYLVMQEFFKEKKEFQLSSIGADNLSLSLFRYELLPQEGFLACNATFFRLLGYSSRLSLFKKKIKDLFFDPKDKDIFFEILRRNDTVRSFEVAFKTKNNQKLWVAVTAALVYTKDNKKCLEGIVQDISYKKELQYRLLMEKNFLECLFQNIPDAVYFKDKNNRIIKVNRFYLEGTGKPKEEIIGKTDFDFFPYEQARQMFEDDNSVLNTGRPIVGKIEKTRLPDGRWNQVITTKIPMYDNSGKIIGTMGTTRDMTAYANLEKQRIDMMVNALEVLGRALEMRDPYTFSHTRNVANIAERISRALNWSTDKCLAIKVAGELHDLGKISIPLDILNKPGELSRLEYGLIQQHAENCYNLIKDIDFPFPLPEIIYQHHELLDGSGYPRHLRGEEIMIEAQILAVSDVLEAMTHHRPYREALGIKAACNELKKGCGIKYDSKIVEVLLSLVEQSSEKPFWLNN